MTGINVAAAGTGGTAGPCPRLPRCQPTSADTMATAIRMRSNSRRCKASITATGHGIPPCGSQAASPTGHAGPRPRPTPRMATPPARMRARQRDLPRKERLRPSQPRSNRVVMCPTMTHARPLGQRSHVGPRQPRTYRKAMRPASHRSSPPSREGSGSANGVSNAAGTRARIAARTAATDAAARARPPMGRLTALAC